MTAGLSLQSIPADGDRRYSKLYQYLPGPKFG